PAVYEITGDLRLVPARAALRIPFGCRQKRAADAIPRRLLPELLQGRCGEAVGGPVVRMIVSRMRDVDPLGPDLPEQCLQIRHQVPAAIARARVEAVAVGRGRAPG